MQRHWYENHLCALYYADELIYFLQNKLKYNRQFDPIVPIIMHKY